MQFVLSSQFDKAGDYTLTATVAPAVGEVNLSNNSIKFNLRVLNTRVRVLYVEGKPRWEYRFLKERLIRATNDIEAQCWLAEADRQFEQEHSATTTALRAVPNGRRNFIRSLRCDYHRRRQPAANKSRPISIARLP